MVVIFGWGSGEAQDRGEVVPIVCPRCHNPVFLHEIQSEKQVSLYFVPMASYGTDVYLACPICRAGAPVDPTRRPAVDSMMTATRSYRTGHLPEDAYRKRAVGFLVSMGFASPVVPDAMPPSGPPGGSRRPAAARPAAAAPSITRPPESTPARPTQPSLAERIADLAKLHHEGVLTDDEFAAAKRRLLDPDS